MWGNVRLGLEPTPTTCSRPLRAADFAHLAQALDYAAEGETGYNFYNGRGDLYAVLPYRTLQTQSRALARHLGSLQLPKGARVALIADTHPDFPQCFFACQYANLVSVPLPLSLNLGNQRTYVEQLRRLLQGCQASVAIAPTGFLPFLREAALGLNLVFVGDVTSLQTLAEVSELPPPPLPTDIAYLQYTSGSTRFPRGVMITQQAVLANLAGIIRDGVHITHADRCMSWLPFYHDMGLVGLLLVPLASQVSVDYLGTRDFAMRPRQWLSLMARNRATISFSPPFGYELIARRIREDEAAQFDLSAWRVAGVGAEMIRREVLDRFAEVLAPAQFNPHAFLPCYGMAEASLAVSFAPLNHPLQVDTVDGDCLAEQGVAPTRVSQFVNCGSVLPDCTFEIRDPQQQPLPDRHSGVIYLRGSNIMSGYFNDAEMTAHHLTPDGWLNTGDIGYSVDGSLFITGRQKDLIIINGRNIWPQDLEHLAEQQPEVRTGDALAFAAPGPEEADITVLVVQCRESDEEKRMDLIDRLQRLIRQELAIDCYIQLVPLHTLPRTSSGKLSRSRARQNFIESHDWERDAPAFMLSRLPKVPEKPSAN